MPLQRLVVPVFYRGYRRSRLHLSPIQAGFFHLRQKTAFNWFWGLQSVFKALSIYTVVCWVTKAHDAVVLSKLNRDQAEN